MILRKQPALQSALCFFILIVGAAGSPLFFESEKHHDFAARYTDDSLHQTKVSQDRSLLSSMRMWGKTSSVSCSVCKYGVSALQKAISFGLSDSAIVVIAKAICGHYEDARVCGGIVNLFKEEVLQVLRNGSVSPDICGYALGQACASSQFVAWNVSLPNTPKPPVNPPPTPKPGSPTLRVLHLTDIHLDALYAAGSQAQCGEPLCCRRDDGKPGPGENGAGRYGDYRNCDTPYWTLEGLFSHLAKQKFDMILWTGDLPAHNVWNQTRHDQTSILRNLTATLRKYFPHTPVYPALGNHESSPVNSFPPSRIKGNDSISWLYDTLAETWSEWLPKEVMPTVRKGAYYTVSPYPGFRIISLNTNACNNMNWWLLFNATDPDGQLAWLVSTLQYAEIKKEKVHIIGHIPPGIDDCLEAWSRNLYRIVDRFESTIVGQFYGHTHFDHFEVFYSLADGRRPTNVAYISPSVTPYSNLNMGYRIFTVDGNYSTSSWAVLDHETYILNLTLANAVQAPPTWQLEYSAKAKFGMKSLLPRDWDNLISRMETDDQLLQTFYRYYYKSHVDAKAPTCDAHCAQALVCGLRSAKSHSSETFCAKMRHPHAHAHRARLTKTMC